LAARFFEILKTTNGLSLSWTALAGRVYKLQGTDNLAVPNWLNLTNLTATAPEASAIDPPVLAERVRFFRVLLSPN
jgi:hypothetical protein